MEQVLIIIIVLLIVLVISQYKSRNKLVRLHEDKKVELEGKIISISNESQNELAATVTRNHKVMEQEKQQQINKLKNNHDVEIAKLEKQIFNLKNFSHNKGEMIAHEILVNLKNDLVNKSIINQDEMIIMGNVFIPFRYKDDDDLNSRQIDHLILLPQGIYVIETKYWRGKVLQGISKDNSDKLSFLVDNIFPSIKSDVEKTLVLNPPKQDDQNNVEFKVVSYDNPVNQVRQTALKLNRYIKEKVNKNIFINSMVYFGYPQNTHNYVKIFSEQQDKFPTLICVGEEDMKNTFISQIEQSEKKYSVEDLVEIKELLNKFNRIN